MAIWECIKDILALQTHLDALDIQYEQPQVYNDNLTAITIACSLKQVPGAKRFLHHCLRIREHYWHEELKSCENLADKFTKALDPTKHVFFTGFRLPRPWSNTKQTARDNMERHNKGESP